MFPFVRVGFELGSVDGDTYTPIDDFYVGYSRWKSLSGKGFLGASLEIPIFFRIFDNVKVVLKIEIFL
jgi:hypothetical protein